MTPSAAPASHCGQPRWASRPTPPTISNAKIEPAALMSSWVLRRTVLKSSSTPASRIDASSYTRARFNVAATMPPPTTAHISVWPVTACDLSVCSVMSATPTPSVMSSAAWTGRHDDVSAKSSPWRSMAHCSATVGWRPSNNHQLGMTTMADVMTRRMRATPGVTRRRCANGRCVITLARITAAASCS